jgi:hypothetical protein
MRFFIELLLSDAIAHSGSKTFNRIYSTAGQQCPQVYFAFPNIVSQQVKGLLLGNALVFQISAHPTVSFPAGQ